MLKTTRYCDCCGSPIKVSEYRIQILKTDGDDWSDNTVDLCEPCYKMFLYPVRVFTNICAEKGGARRENDEDNKML